MFKFPIDPNIRTLWTKAIHRKDFTPSDNSTVCEKHFTKNDFKKMSSDSNATRQKGKKFLSRKVLNKTAIPSIFPGYPMYYANPKVAPKRSEATTSTGRIERENEEICKQNTKLMNDDVIHDLVDLKQKFSHQKPGLMNYVMYDEMVNGYTCFIHLDCSSVPKIDSSIKVFSDLTFKAYYEQDLVAETQYASAMQFSSRLLRFSDFLNLLSCIRSLVQPPTPIPRIVKALQTYSSTSILLNPKSLHFY
jgi:hypothetical protein